MKKLSFFWIFAVTTIVANAQDTYSNQTSSTTKHFIWSIGVNPSIPIGHFNDLSSFGLGGNIQGEYKPGKVGITLNIGYVDYFGKTEGGISIPDYKYWPLMGGLKYYIGKTYLHGQAGLGFGTNGLGTSFWYGGGYGVNLSKAFDIELQYMGWKQDIISETGTGGSGSPDPGPGPSPSPSPGPGPGDPGYGGHYSTLGLRLAYNF